MPDLAPSRGRLTPAVVGFLALYLGLTVWITIGRDLVAETAFTSVKNIGYVATMIVGVWALRDAIAASWSRTRARPWFTAAMALVGVALMGVASGLSELVRVLAGAPAVGANQAAIIHELLDGTGFPVTAILFVLVGGVVAPIVEELVFREVPFARLRRWLPTPVAFALTCVAFGALHVRGVDEWPLLILYAGYSAALSVAYLVSGRNIIASVGAHVVWNTAGLVFLLVAALVA